MTTVRSSYPHARRAPQGHHADTAAPGRGGAAWSERQQARRAHRRRVREEILAVGILAVALLATLVLLGLEWLGSDSPSASARPQLTYIVGGGIA